MFNLKFAAAALLLSLSAVSTHAASLMDGVLNGFTLEMPQEEAMVLIEKRYKAANSTFDRSTCREFSFESLEIPTYGYRLKEGFPNTFAGFEVIDYEIDFREGKLGGMSVNLVINKGKDGNYNQHF